MGDEERGRRQQSRHTDRDYLEAVADLQPAGTAAVAEWVGVARQNADRRLRRLEDEDKVRSEMVGNSLAWYLVDERAVASPVDPADAFWEADTYKGDPASADDADDPIHG